MYVDGLIVVGVEHESESEECKQCRHNSQCLEFHAAKIQQFSDIAHKSLRNNYALCIINYLNEQKRIRTSDELLGFFGFIRVSFVWVTRLRFCR